METAINILLSEDNNGSILLVNEVLKQTEENTILHVERSAENTLNYLKQTTNLPDIIILDLNMPRKDGWYILDHFFSEGNHEGLPVFILSTSILMTDRMKAREYPNVAGFYTKPITSKKMNEILGHYEKKKK